MTKPSKQIQRSYIYKGPKSISKTNYVSDQTGYCKKRAYINYDDALKHNIANACPKCGLYHEVNE